MTMDAMPADRKIKVKVGIIFHLAVLNVSEIYLANTTVNTHCI